MTSKRRLAFVVAIVLFLVIVLCLDVLCLDVLCLDIVAVTEIEIPELVGAEHAAWHVVLDLADAPPLIGTGSVGVPRCVALGRNRDAAETLARRFDTQP